MVKQITKIALKGVAMAMGIAVIVMSTLGTLELDNGVAMLGLGWPRWPSPACRSKGAP